MFGTRVLQKDTRNEAAKQIPGALKLALRECCDDKVQQKPLGSHEPGAGQPTHPHTEFAKNSCIRDHMSVHQNVDPLGLLASSCLAGPFSRRAQGLIQELLRKTLPSSANKSWIINTCQIAALDPSKCVYPLGLT